MHADNLVCNAGTEHFAIGDAEALVAPTLEKDLLDVVQSLEMAMSTVRAAVTQAVGHLRIEQNAINVKHASRTAATRQSELSSLQRRALSQSGNTRGASAPANGVTQIACKLAADTGGVGLDDADELREEQNSMTSRLTQENEMLRGTLGDVARRLRYVESEQERFRCEGVFDLVNSLCR